MYTAGTDAGVSCKTTGMTAADSGVSATTKAASVAATTAVASAAMLRPEGYGEKKRERRDGNQATHNENIITRMASPARVSGTIPGTDRLDNAAARIFQRLARKIPVILVPLGK